MLGLCRLYIRSTRTWARPCLPMRTLCSLPFLSCDRARSRKSQSERRNDDAEMKRGTIVSDRCARTERVWVYGKREREGRGRESERLLVLEPAGVLDSARSSAALVAAPTLLRALGAREHADVRVCVRRARESERVRLSGAHERTRRRARSRERARASARSVGRRTGDEPPCDAGPARVAREDVVELGRERLELPQAGPGDGGEVVVLLVEADVVAEDVERAVAVHVRGGGMRQ